MTITVNQEIVSRYKAEKLSIEYLGCVLIILLAVYEQDIKLLDAMDEGNKDRSMLTLYQYLCRKKLLEEADEVSPYLYQLTEKGVDLVNFLESQAVNIKEEEKSTEKNTEEVKDWISTYISLFPEEIIYGRYLRSSPRECIDRMQWFMKKYKYSKQTILKATADYIDSQSSSPDGHKFTTGSNYFIFKGKDSVDRASGLAAWCERATSTSNNIYFQRDVI